MHKNTILGLDVSTSITGASIIGSDGELLFCEAWRTDKKGYTFYQKLDIIKHKLYSVIINHRVDKVYVEEPLIMFAAGKSSAQTISLIQRYNGAVCWMCREIYDIEPIYVRASTARKLYNIKVPRGQNTKEIILEHVLAKEPKFSIKQTRFGNPEKGSYDRADSIVVARAGYHIANSIEKKA